MPKNVNYILNTTHKQNCGLNATCIAYRRYSDIDVMFEDGVCVEHKTIQSFIEGSIRHPNLSKMQARILKSSCKDKTVFQKCGMNATCIFYRGARDIDVQFEDGTIVKNRAKSEFLSGKIHNPSLKRKKVFPVKTGCLGEERLMNNGLKATCVAYRARHDIDVAFEDGVLVQHRTKQNFERGSIRHPSLSRTHSRIIKSSCFGQTIMQNCGMNATCISYRNARDIDVRFEDGTIIEHRDKGGFYKGNIQNPNLKRRMSGLIEKASCLGEERLMNNGMKAVCIAYRGWNDIDVRFEDGTIVEHRKKGDFLIGNIQSPLWWEKSFPQRVVYECIHKAFPDAIFNCRPAFMKNKKSGLNLELDIWIPSISSAIEYDGFPWHSKETSRSKEKYELIIKSHDIKRIYTFIEKGCIEHHSAKHKNIIVDTQHVTSNYDKLEKAINELLSCLDIKDKINLDDDTLNAIREKCKNQNLGMTMKQNCGMMATCIAYRDHNDIDVQFEDGTIVKNRGKSAFLKGLIKNPELYKAIQNQNSLNTTVKMKNGMMATCIAYRKSIDIDVRFEDGTVVEHVQKQHFLRGNVKHPNLENPKIAMSSCVGTTLRMKNGMLATCIAYRNGLDLDIQFEDGTIVTNKRKGNFVRGEVDNPNYNRHSCVGKTIVQSCGMEATCISYRNCGDIDVQFEDGAIVKNKQKSQFVAGQIGYPKK